MEMHKIDVRHAEGNLIQSIAVEHGEIELVEVASRALTVSIASRQIAVPRLDSTSVANNAPGLRDTRNMEQPKLFRHAILLDAKY